MAQEATVRVVVDTEQAKRSMQEVNGALEKSRGLGAGLAGSIQNIGRVVAAVAGAAGGILDQAVPGSVRAIGGTLLTAAGAGWSGMLGGFGQQLAQFVGQFDANQKALSATKSLVGAGGTFDDSEVERIFKDFRSLFLQGSMNEVMADRVYQRETGKQVGDALNSIPAIDRLTDEIAKLVIEVQNWNPFK